MVNDNFQKKKALDNIILKYDVKISALKEKRDKIISDFLAILKEKKLEELRNSLKQS